MSDNIPADGQTVPPKSRHKLRLAAIGGIAAIAILGGGITAVASASAPAAGAAAVATTTPSAAPTSGSNTAAPKPAERKPHLEGTVTSVSGTAVQIKDRDGFIRTIIVSSKTTYNDGLKAALATGTKIHAEGTVDANGTSLDATVIGADKGPQGGPGGFRGPGGRPGGPRDGHGPGDGQGPANGTPPTGTKPTGTKPAPTTAPTTTAPTTS